MAAEGDFLECVNALDEVTASFLDARSVCHAPSKYEADMASFKLMEVVYRHVNAFSVIALMPKPGSHEISTWPLLRAAFESSLTALWLVSDPDWKEREARWLGWMAGEEEYQRNLANDIRRHANGDVSGFLGYADRLEERRLAITRLLPKDSREKRPSVPRMLRECGIPGNHYVTYRIGSQLSHGGPACLAEVWQDDGKIVALKDISYSSWVSLFQIASWCIVLPGKEVLLRAGAAPEAVNRMIDAHDRLRECVTKLQG